MQGPAGMVPAGAPGLAAGQKLGPFRILETGVSSDAVVVMLTPQETGDLEIPAFDVLFKTPAGEEKKARAPAVRVRVESVLGEGDATALADLKPPADFPIPWPWKRIVLGAAAGAALIAAGVWLLRRLRRPRAPRPLPEQTLPPGITPDIWAREALAALLARRLVEEGQLREFHIELADLLRRYTELRFRVPALERTTEEIREELARALVSEDVARLALGTLSACDRVKFAKYAPGPGEIASTVGSFRDLVDRTGVELAPAAGAMLAASGSA